MIYKYFLSFSGLSFHFLDNVFDSQNMFILMKSKLPIFFLLLLVFALSYLRTRCQIQGHVLELFCKFSRWALTFRLLIHFIFCMWCEGSNLHLLHVSPVSFPSSPRTVYWKEVREFLIWSVLFSLKYCFSKNIYIHHFAK